jgi:hypothetical protein
VQRGLTRIDQVAVFPIAKGVVGAVFDAGNDQFRPSRHDRLEIDHCGLDVQVGKDILHAAQGKDLVDYVTAPQGVERAGRSLIEHAQVRVIGCSGTFQVCQCGTKLGCHPGAHFCRAQSLTQDNQRLGNLLQAV